MFQQTFKNIDDVLWKEAGCTTELDYTEQTSWMLFLKYLDDLEQERSMEAELVGKTYEFIIDEAHHWSKWAAPKKEDGSFDHDAALTGDDLIQYIDNELFPYLKGFKQRATGPDTIEYKIGEIFGEIKNKFQSGYSLRDALELMDALRFRSQKEKHELSHLYEAKIKNMGNAGRNGGEYYTPRPLIRAMVQVVKPKIGERIYDGAVGSAGFLCEAYDYLRQGELTTGELQTLQTKTFYGKEKKSLAYVIAIMNMILHGIDTPNIIHTNTLAENLADIQDKDRFDVVLANPPFGGKERAEVQQNFPIKTGETAFLFLQHFIKTLKAGGRGAVVIKNTFLSNSDNASKALRKELLGSCNLHSVLDCPGGTFLGAGVKTVVLFFDKGAPTRKVWYYQLDPGRNMGKTNSLNDNDLKEFVELQASFAESEKSWSVDVTNIDQDNFDLSVKNPNTPEAAPLREPEAIISEIVALDAESADILKNIRGDAVREEWKIKPLVDVCFKITDGSHYSPKTQGNGYPYITVRDIQNEKGLIDFENCKFIAESDFEDLVKNGCKPERGDVLFSKDGTVGKVSLIDYEKEFVVLSSLAIVRVNNNEIYPEYLRYIMRAPFFLKEAIGKKTGVAIRRIVLKNLKTIKIPFPPLPEQKRIVAILDEAFAGIDKAIANTQQNLANARELFESYLNTIFTQKGEGWMETKLSNFMDISHGFAFKGHDFKSSDNGLNPIVLTPGNYSEDGKLYFTEKNTKRFTGSLPKNYLFDVDDLTIVMTDLSSKMKILGKPAFIDKPNILHNQRIGRVIFKEPGIVPRFIYYYLMTRMVSEKIKETSTGTMVRHTAPKRILTLDIALPPEQTEQLNIISTLDSISAETKYLETIYQKKLTALAELKQSLLQKAFSGELTADNLPIRKEATA